mgnify:CR=1 FL=1
MLKIRLLENKLLKVKLNNIIPRIVLAKMQEKEVIPTKEKQEVLPDKNFDGLSKVIVSKIPDEYIVPNGDLEISQNGTFDVADKVNAIVNVPEKKLGTKTITINGTYKATDDNLDGYNEVEVATSGVDINEYFGNLPNFSGSSWTAGGWVNMITKLPVISFSGTNLAYAFAGYQGTELDLSNFDTSKVIYMNYMFYRCSSLTNLDLSNFGETPVASLSLMFYVCSSLETINLSNFENTRICPANQMFAACRKLKNINISKFDFTKVTNYTKMFEDVPNDCYILVKDAEAKEWITTRFTNLTNVHYVGEEG